MFINIMFLINIIKKANLAFRTVLLKVSIAFVAQRLSQYRIETFSVVYLISESTPDISHTDQYVLRYVSLDVCAKECLVKFLPGICNKDDSLEQRVMTLLHWLQQWTELQRQLQQCFQYVRCLCRISSKNYNQEQKSRLCVMCCSLTRFSCFF